MPTELRRTGIDAVGDVPWGTHFCHFYETKDDLLDILIPYFRTGLEGDEICLWVVFDPLDEDEVRNVLREAGPWGERHLASGDITILPVSQWCRPDGTLDVPRAIDTCRDMLARALARGRSGMRVNGNEVMRHDGGGFAEYENALKALTAAGPMIVLCTYPLASSRAADVFDVARTHDFAVVRRHGRWETLETVELGRARAEIDRLQEELGQRVAAKTRELAATNARLTAEIAERESVEEALRESETRFRSFFDLGLIGMSITSPTKGMIVLNDEICRILGYERRELLRLTWVDVTHPDDRAADIANFNRALAGELDAYSREKRFIRKDGQVIDATMSVKCLRRPDRSVAYFLVLVQDITDQKRAEAALRTFSRRLVQAQEAERRHIARELHDEMGQLLTGLLLLLDTSPRAPASAVETSMREARGLAVEALARARDLSLDLRPAMLDDLGLLPALLWHIERYTASTRITVSLKHAGLEGRRFAPEIETAAYRIIQEALTNVARHSGTQEARVYVAVRGDLLILRIEDSGAGFDPAIALRHVSSSGLSGMRERVMLAGGSLTVESVPGAGTRLMAELPLEPPLT